MSCINQPEDRKAEVIFYGEKGSLAIAGKGYTIYDLKGKTVRKEDGPAHDNMHFNNLLAGIREGKPLNSEIEEGHKSTLLCHLGNIAQRLGKTLHCDPKNGKCARQGSPGPVVTGI